MSYTAKEINSIVAEIFDWLKMTASQVVRGSWGAHSYQAIIYNNMPALCFCVSGCLHKGWVVICYNDCTDLYDIYYLNVRREIKRCDTGVYCDVLGQVIDAKIERPIGANDDKYFKMAMRDSRNKSRINQ